MCIDRSDLYEKPGKSPHAFCTDIDRDGRRPRAGEHRAQRILDGHDAPRARAFGLQQQEHPGKRSLRLRREAHILTTEGVAMMFERFSKDADWLAKMGVQGRRPGGIRRDRAQDAPQPAADLLALVPGDAPVREGDVRRTPTRT